jgi:HlyD family secretion protein
LRSKKQILCKKITQTRHKFALSKKAGKLMIFPPEIINDTTETLFVRRSTRSNVTYLTVVLAVAAVIVSLPFIYVEITTQARGIIRTPFENNQLQTVVSGEITDIFISENTEVRKGDTLLILNAEPIQEQINRKEEKIREDSSFICDIALMRAENAKPTTAKYSTEYRYFQSAVNEQQTKINFL